MSGSALDYLPLYLQYDFYFLNHCQCDANEFLKHADNAQQNFSSDGGPSLHLALPALEALYKAWDSRSSQLKYSIFSTGLSVVKKISEYYEHTADSDGYV